MRRAKRWTILLFLVFVGRATFAESQGQDYKGVVDPFGDPANYEFAEDEKEDKEFFHLGRYLMLGVDFGVAIFSGGLGRTVEPGPYLGARLIYFFDKAIALEAAVHYSNHLDTINPNPSQLLEIDTSMIPIDVGFRYYFDTRNAPRAIAIANPYLAFGGGVYMRSQNVLPSVTQFNVTTGETTTSSFGTYGGGGVEFTIYRRHIYLGIDLRYHLVFFPDETETFGTQDVDRSGDYVTAAATLTYNF